MKKAQREVFGYGMKQLASRREFCFWPGDTCSDKAVRAHSVQNTRVMDLLCSSDGHVIMPKLEMTLSKTPRIVFQKIGRATATTFTGLCGKHDHALFKPIEVGPIDPQIPKHLFLLAFRAVLKEAHATRKAAIDLQLSYQKGVEVELFPKDKPSPPGMLAVEQMMAAYLVEGTRLKLAAAYLADNWHRTEHKVFDLDVSPCIAVNAMLSTGLYSEASDDLAFVTLNVLPTDRKTVVVFSYLAEHRAQATEAFGHIWTASGHYQKYLMSKFILSRCENLVIAPDTYETFPQRQREVITTFFERNTCGQTYELDDPNIFLFGPNHG